MSEGLTYAQLMERGTCAPLAVSGDEPHLPTWVAVYTPTGKEYWNRWDARFNFRQRDTDAMPRREERGR